MTGIEIDFVVTDSRAALELYERVFGAERVEVTAYDKGLNEAVFTLNGVRFHMLDENPEYALVAPKASDSKTMWVNVIVPNIETTHKAAIDAGFTEIQPLNELPDFGVINCVLSDPFGYVWMVHQVNREVSFEERNKIWETGKTNRD